MAAIIAATTSSRSTSREPSRWWPSRGSTSRWSEGEFVAIVGRSGAGKSTLLTILAGLDRPSAGKAEVAGMELDDLDHAGTRHPLPAQRRLPVAGLHPQSGAVPQGDPERRAADAARRGRNQEAAQAGLALLEVTGLRNRTFADVHMMSGGEQQRLALCVALSLGPKLLLADEPTGELDTETSLQVYELLRRLCPRGRTDRPGGHPRRRPGPAHRPGGAGSPTGASRPRAGSGAAELLHVDQRGMVQIPRRCSPRLASRTTLKARVVDSGILLQRERRPR